MSDNRFSSDDLKLRFIFVPHDEPPPDEAMDGHTDWVKIPGHLEPRDDGDRAAGQPARVSPDGGTSGGTRYARPTPPLSSLGPSPAPDSVPLPAGVRLADNSAEGTATGLAGDPIAAYLRANEAFAAAPERGASAKSNASPTQPSERLRGSSPDQGSPGPTPRAAKTEAAHAEQPRKDTLRRGDLH